MDDVHLKRRLTAVLLADVVGYSRLMSADEEGTHLRLTDYVQNLIDPAVAKHRGRLIRSMGDGMLVEFDSALDAVRCAIEVQRGLAECEANQGEQRIQLRIGVNTGDVIVDERDIYGNSINIAARLEGLAEPSQIYVTRGVRDQLLGYPNLSFEDKGECRVKNIERPVRVYRVEYDLEARSKSAARGLVAVARRWSAAGFPRNARATSLIGAALLTVLAILTTAFSPGWFKSPPLPPRASIVVMPFDNYSGDAQQGYVADAITDDVTTDVARLKGIFVIARDTAFTFKGRSVDAREVGKECGVRYLLEGSIIRFGNKIETNVQLIDAQTGGLVWADRFQSDLSDLFALKAAVSGRIAASLNIQLAKAEGERARQQPAADPDAVDLRFRAMAIYFSGISPEHTFEARELLEHSVRLDPSSAEAWAWLADLLASDYLNRWNDTAKEQLIQADDAVRKALALDPDLDLAYFAKGFIHRAKGENAAALDAFGRSVELNPNFARAYAQKANELINVGRPAEAPPLLMKAIELSPLDPSIGVFYWNLGRAEFFSSHYENAIPWLRKAVALRPNLWYNWLYLVSSQSLLGNDKEAQKTLIEFISRRTPGDPKLTLGLVKKLEQANPNNNPVIVEGREKFHEGLLKAGLSAN